MNYIFDNERPIYIQLVERLRIEIVSGQLKMGQKLPSVRELALIVKVNPNTVQKALQELEKENIIYTERTNGKFVTSDEKLILQIKKKLFKEKVDTFIKDAKSIGMNSNDIIEYLQELDI